MVYDCFNHIISYVNFALKMHNPWGVICIHNALEMHNPWGVICIHSSIAGFFEMEPRPSSPLGRRSKVGHCCFFSLVQWGTVAKECEESAHAKTQLGTKKQRWRLRACFADPASFSKCQRHLAAEHEKPLGGTWIVGKLPKASKWEVTGISWNVHRVSAICIWRLAVLRSRPGVFWPSSTLFSVVAYTARDILFPERHQESELAAKWGHMKWGMAVWKVRHPEISGPETAPCPRP